MYGREYKEREEESAATTATTKQEAKNGFGSKRKQVLTRQ